MYPGYLAKILLPAGSKDIPIGKLLCIICDQEDDVQKFSDFVDDSKDEAPKKEEKKEAAAPAAPAAPAPAAAPAKSAPPPPSGKRAFATPAARKMAEEKGIDLSQVKSGSGINGMITTADVEDMSPMAAAAAGGAGGGGAAPGAGPLGAGVQAPWGGVPLGEYTSEEIAELRRTMAKRLQSSKMEIPHYYLTVECDVDALLKLQGDINKQYSKEGIKLSVNDFIIKATGLASKRVPECNSHWMGEAIREYHTCDVSVAVDTGDGLITPIIQAVEYKGLAEISETVKVGYENYENCYFQKIYPRFKSANQV